MKSKSLGILAALITTIMTATAAEGVHLFILSGQSNMAALKPEASFTPAVEKAFGADKVIVVKDAVSGQPIRRWHKEWKPAEGDEPKATGDLYDRLMKKVQTATKDKEIESVTFLWMQGERDAREKHGEVYKDSLAGLMEQIKKDLKYEDLNFVIGRLSDFDMEDKKYPHWTMVRKAQVDLAESSPRGAWVDTDDLNNKGANGEKNDLHYTKEGYTILGERFAEKAIALIKEHS